MRLHTGGFVKATSNTNVKGNDGPESTVRAGNPAARNPRDARGNKAAQKKNRKELDVAEDHKTEDMEKAHRGTFP
jgi:hypothetical protein